MIRSGRCWAGKGYLSCSTQSPAAAVVKSSSVPGFSALTQAIPASLKMVRGSQTRLLVDTTNNVSCRIHIPITEGTSGFDLGAVGYAPRPIPVIWSCQLPELRTAVSIRFVPEDGAIQRTLTAHVHLCLHPTSRTNIARLSPARVTSS